MLAKSVRRTGIHRLRGDQRMAQAMLSYKEGDEPIPGYRLVKELGKGGSGQTWQATAPGGFHVAFKIVDLQERLGWREIAGLSVVRNLTHPHLCKIWGVWAKDKNGCILDDSDVFPPGLDVTVSQPALMCSRAVQLIIAMELGEATLETVLARYNPPRPEGRSDQPDGASTKNEVVGIPVPELLGYIEAAGRAVDHLNRHEICHCDIKPGNILLVDGQAKVCDFGLARVVQHRRRTGNAYYSPQFGAPEMVDQNSYDPRMDQYSLALTYATLRTGRLPFPTASPSTWTELEKLTKEKVNGEFELCSLPRAEREVIARALSPDPDDRFASVTEMLEALHTATIPARRSTWLVLIPIFALVSVIMGIVGVAAYKYYKDAFGGAVVLPPTPPPRPRPEQVTEQLEKVRAELREFSETSNIRSLESALLKVEFVLECEPGNAQAVEQRNRCLEGYLHVVAERLKIDEAKSAQTHLQEILRHLKRFPASATDNIGQRTTLAMAYAEALEDRWQQVGDRLATMRQNAASLPGEDRTRFRLLEALARWHAVREFAASEQGLAILAEVKNEVRNSSLSLRPWEAKELRRFETESLTIIDGVVGELSGRRLELVVMLWPNLKFKLELVKLFKLLASDQSDKLAEVGPLLSSLRQWATTAAEKWDLQFASIWFDFLQREPKGRLRQGLDNLAILLQEPSGSSLRQPHELFTVLYERFAGDLAAGHLDPETTLQGCALWKKAIHDGVIRADVPLDVRFRTFAVVARLSQDLPDDKAMEEDALKLIDSGSILVRAAWAETLLVRPDRTPELHDPRHEAVVTVLRTGQPGNVYPDYIRFVQAWLLDHLDQRTQEAAALLCPSDAQSGKPLSPAMGVARRRSTAVGILARAIEALREPGGGVRAAEAFTAAKAALACKYLNAVDLLSEGLPGQPADWVNLEENRILARGTTGQLPPARVIQSIEDLIQRKKGTLSLLELRASATRQELAANPKANDARDRVLRAYADLLRGFAEPQHAKRFQAERERILKEAVAVASSLPLVALLAKLDLPQLVEQLAQPGPDLSAAVAALRERDAVALIYGLEGARLQRVHGDQAGEILSCLQALALVAWLSKEPTDRARYLVELGETVKLVPRLEGLKKLEVIDVLAKEATEAAPNYHGVYGLQGYTQINHARRETDPARQKALLETARDSYQKALQATPAPPRSMSARYLIGVSTALVERACLLGRPLEAKVREPRQTLLREAVAAATAATLIEEPIDAPEDAFRAKGHAEEDLAWYVGEAGQFAVALESFTNGVNVAENGRRAPAKDLLARGRCRYREMVRATDSGSRTAGEIAQLVQAQVLEDLQAAAKGTTDEAVRTEAHLWIGQAELLLARLDEPGRSRHLTAADAAHAAAAKMAAAASLPDWAKYQQTYVQVAELLTSDPARSPEAAWAQVRDRSKNLLEAASDPQRGPSIAPAIVYYAALTHYDALLFLERGQAVDAMRKGVEDLLARFPADDPQRVGYHIRLLAQRARWIRLYAKSRIDEAGRDAETAVQLATKSAATDPTEKEEWLGLAHGVLGQYYDVKFQSQFNPTSLAVAWESGRRAKEELTRALQHYAAYRERRPVTDADEAFSETQDFRFALGALTLELLKNYRDKFARDESVAMKTAGQKALLSLRDNAPLNARKTIQKMLDEYESLPKDP